MAQSTENRAILPPGLPDSHPIDTDEVFGADNGLSKPQPSGDRRFRARSLHRRIYPSRAIVGDGGPNTICSGLLRACLTAQAIAQTRELQTSEFQQRSRDSAARIPDMGEK
jgi:hypothetical protein